MVWESDGVKQKSPSSYKLTIQDQDVDSYRSKVTAALIDRVIAQGLLQGSLSFNCATQEEAEDLMEETFKNPMNLKIKAPILGKKTIEASFRCAKRDVEMIQTDDGINGLKTYWRASFNIMQKKKVKGQ